MVQLKASLVTLALFLASASASTMTKRAGTRTLTSQQIKFYQPFSNYAAAAYCPLDQINSWSCGSDCEANAGFTTSAAGGDGETTPQWYVGYDPNLKTVIVAHEGSDESNAVDFATDNGNLSQLDKTNFPRAPTGAEVTSGVQELHAQTANTIYYAVRDALAAYPNTNSVTVVGHGPGAALALLDSMYLEQHLYAGVKYQTYLYALPRIGNQAFANFVDESNSNLVHINNQEDIVPDLPSTKKGYVQPRGEIHIQDNGNWVSCSGQDNNDPQCTAGDVNHENFKKEDYYGPYDSVYMSC